jgi:branched-subunit amino acid aminotransferase/4-amino-4-deoxychorismate lyase
MEPQAWMNGTWAAEAETRLPLDDAMVTHGAGLVEVLRTWAGVPVFLDRHLDRFIQAAGEMGLRLPVTSTVLASLVTEYLDRLPASLAGKDRHVVLLATPGSPGQRSATLVIHGRALDSARHRDYRENGVALARSKVKALPCDVVPARWKHRNRLHWHLETATGIVTETAIGHVVMVEERAGKPLLVTPPEELVLPGITLGLIQESAEKQGLGWTRRPFTWNELARSKEILLVGSGFGVAGVSQLDGVAINWPGQVTQNLSAGFGALVGEAIR